MCIKIIKIIIKYLIKANVESRKSSETWLIDSFLYIGVINWGKNWLRYCDYVPVRYNGVVS